MVHYALSQAVSLVVIGGDNPAQVQELAQAAREFKPMSGRAAPPGRGRGPLRQA